MANKFDFWVQHDADKFIRFYWTQYGLFYILAIWITLHSGTLSAFFVIGLLEYLVIFIFRWPHNPFNNMEDWIKKYNPILYERLSALISEKYNKQPKRRAASIYDLLMREPKDKLDSALLAFKKNYNRINTHAMMSLSLWFCTALALTIYMYITRS